ncbi:MAG TPA: zf-HC2 domain-containing protein [bacterium]|nr:zf-HC2 domain-containing protein [bacterium]HPG44513.1 zf-HC2 domain-containing protein [bacterium]HPM97071.1 zf-HC2 domain-containing protein [bacterium]
MSKTSFTDHKCPGSAKFELLLLDVDLTPTERKRLQLHLQQCPACQKLTREIDDFYKVLLQELRFPISNKVLQFAQNVAPRPMQFALVIGDLIENGHEPGERAYRMRVVKQNADDKIASNGGIAAGGIKHDQIVLRVLIDAEKNSRLLSLWFVEMDNSREWILRIPGTDETFQLNSCGCSRSASLQIEKWEGAVAYLSGKKNPPESRTRFSRITHALECLAE